MPGPRDLETHPEARTTGETGALPTPPACQRRGNSTGNAWAGPQEEAEGDSREGLDRESAKQMAVKAAEEETIPAAHLAADILPATLATPTSTTCPRAAPQSGTEPCTDCATAGTDRPGTDEEGPRDPQEPTPGAQVEETPGDADAPPPTTEGDRAHHRAAADPGLNARAPPAASLETADAAGWAPCPQATR